MIGGIVSVALSRITQLSLPIAPDWVAVSHCLFVDHTTHMVSGLSSPRASSKRDYSIYLKKTIARFYKKSSIAFLVLDTTAGFFTFIKWVLNIFYF